MLAGRGRNWNWSCWERISCLINSVKWRAMESSPPFLKARTYGITSKKGTSLSFGNSSRFWWENVLEISFMTHPSLQTQNEKRHPVSGQLRSVTDFLISQGSSGAAKCLISTSAFPGWAAELCMSLLGSAGDDPPFQEADLCLPQAGRGWLEMSPPKPAAAFPVLSSPVDIPTEI